LNLQQINDALGSLTYENNNPLPRLPVQIRWMVNVDMPTVLSIESRSFDHPWTEEDFREARSQRNISGMIADEGHAVQGFMLYQLQRDGIEILNLAVDPDARDR